MSDSEKPKSWKERRQSIRHKWLVPFIFPEWLCERLSYFLGRWAFVDILEHAGRFAILVAVVSYIWGYPERQRQAENQRKAKHYQAWQVITVSQGKPGGGGRKDALEDLNKDNVSLAGVDISKAFLPELNLADADLADANLAGAVLTDANLAGAVLTDANLSGAKLFDANLAGAKLARANLTGAELTGANLARTVLWVADLAGAYLSGADLAGAALVVADLAGAVLVGADLAGAVLTDANLAGAALTDANLAGAVLTDANLAGAKLGRANLAGADLWGANLKNIMFWREISSIEQAKIYAVQNPPEGFMEWATAPEQGAVRIKDEEEWDKMVKKKWQERKQ